MKNIDLVLKSLDELSKHFRQVKATSGLNKMGYTHANELVSNGKVIKPNSWNPPSTQEENAYIEKNGIEKYAMWFLGEDSSTIATTKSNFSYIYTSDFVNVDRAGLIAIRQRAGQQKETAIFEAAGKLLVKIDA